ncbi:cell division protein ZipA [Glaciecola sp. KUL10]|uniref:cell division protein ZipA n=1 Tax=Glaciecola sp. (strain KUL10) TaxID=2161813 RepID=UPI000D78BA87|nr:cell division protein ZipA [Glaciecola sp. KUL10]GBL03270.1 cell division protein ZipA [Glaciecola sp. KUL10]
MDDLRLAFLVFGVLAIVGILLHGLWTIRKNSKIKQRRVEPKSEFQSAIGGFEQNTDVASNDSLSSNSAFDQDGVGQVRVLKNEEPAAPIKLDIPSFTSKNDATAIHAETDNTQTQEDNERAEAIQHANQHEDKILSFGPHFIDGQVAPSDIKLDEQADKKDVLEDLSLESSNMTFTNTSATTSAEETKPLYGNVVTQPKPGFMQQSNQAESSSTDVPEPPAYLLKQGEEQALNQVDKPVTDAQLESQVETSVNEKLKTEPTPIKVAATTKTQAPEPVPEPEPEPKGLAAQARRLVSRRRKSVADKIRKEPKLKAEIDSTEEQMKIDFDGANKQTASNAANDKPKTKPAQQEVLVLHVRAPDDLPIQGSALLPMLLTLGFKFGEQDIFHRHVNTNGKGQVLFSIANMFKPGHFDIDAIETFTTRGLALFMMLPIEGDPQQVFNMMHNATRKLAEEFSCEILDGSRQPLSKQALQKYSEKIREFEKQSQGG